MSDVNYATIHVYDFQRFVLAVSELEKAGWEFKKDRWVAPETAQTVVEYPAGLTVNISGCTSDEQATLRAAAKSSSSSRIEKAAKDMGSAMVQNAAKTFEEIIRQDSTVTDINKRLDALDPLVKQAFRAIEITRDIVDHRTEHFKIVGDHRTLELLKLTETVKSLSSKLEDTHTAIDNLTRRVAYNAVSGTEDKIASEDRYAEQQELNSCLLERVSGLEYSILEMFSDTTKGENTLLEQGVVRAIQHMLKPGGLLHMY